jgi:hypothetical protein
MENIENLENININLLIPIRIKVNIRKNIIKPGFIKFNPYLNPPNIIESD